MRGVEGVGDVMATSAPSTAPEGEDAIAAAANRALATPMMPRPTYCNRIRRDDFIAGFRHINPKLSGII